MESGITVYKRVIPGADLRETIQKCLVVYEDKLLARSNLPDEGSRDRASKLLLRLDLTDEENRDGARRALEIEKILSRHTDTFLPDRFKGNGYSRLRGVYAYPYEFPESGCYPNLIPPKNGVTKGETIMMMRVDGSSALVLPMKYINGFYDPYIIPQFNESEDMEKIREYWASAVSLEEFARDFEKSDWGNIWQSQGKRTIKNFWRSRSDRRRKIQDPEVIIPEWALEKVSFLNAS